MRLNTRRTKSRTSPVLANGAVISRPDRQQAQRYTGDPQSAKDARRVICKHKRVLPGGSPRSRGPMRFTRRMSTGRIVQSVCHPEFETTEDEPSLLIQPCLSANRTGQVFDTLTLHVTGLFRRRSGAVERRSALLTPDLRRDEVPGLRFHFRRDGLFREIRQRGLQFSHLVPVLIREVPLLVRVVFQVEQLD